MSTGLNIGCGEHYAEGYVNIDLRRGNHVPDLIADVRDLHQDFLDGVFDRVYCGHVLEHLTPIEITSQALPEIARVLRPGGELMVVGPDYPRALRLYPDDKALHDSIAGRDAPYGPDVENPGDHHRWIADGSATLALVQTHFPNAIEIDIADVSDPWPTVSRVDWQFAIQATKEG